tara:strand:+ start:226 stop:1011 length:786 start_codon:yes stop_codon:yes gene_type:complete
MILFEIKNNIIFNTLNNQFIGELGNQSEKLNFKNNFTNISQDSLYLGFLDGFKILIIAFAAGLFIRYLYKKYATTYSSRDDYGNTILILTISTAALIAVVKSSLALSLGLVGALSVVRFRTAVKEPLNLGFLLFTICIGIAIGASQILFGITTLIFGAISIIFIYLKSGVKSAISKQTDSSIDSITFNAPIDINLQDIFNLLSQECEFYELLTFEQDSDSNNCNISLRVKFKSLNSLENFRNKINIKYKNSNLIFYNSPLY